MKKIIALMLAVMLLAGIFCGCGKDTKKAPKNEITFEEQVILENEDCKVTMTGYEVDEMWGPKFTCKFENNSDKNLSFVFNDGLVNGNVALDEYFSESVNAGAQSIYDMTWLEFSLKANGINYIENYKGILTVSDADDFFADPFYEEPFEVTVGNSTTEPSVTEPTFDYEAKVLCDTDDVTITLLDVTYDKTFDYPLAYVKVENKSADTTISYSANNAEVNGNMITSWWGGSIPAGGYSITRFTFNSSDLEAAEIKEIESCKFTLRVYDSNDIFADDLVNEQVEF